MRIYFIVGLLVLFLAACGEKSNNPVDNFKANKAERGESWEQFKHDASFGTWVFTEEERPREHKTPQSASVFYNGDVTGEELDLVDAGLSEMLTACRRDTNQWQPGSVWTKFVYFQRVSDFKVIFVPSNYTLQEGEAAGCAGMITGAGGSITAAGTVGGIVEINGAPASKGGIYIIVPKQSPEQMARAECKTLLKNAVRHEAEHVWFTNSPMLFGAYANDGLNGNHPYCRGIVR